MKRGLSVAASLTAVAAAGWLSACGDQGGSPKAAEAEAAAAAAPAAERTAPTPAPAGPVTPAAEGAPDFAVVYPGGTPDGPATLAQSPTGPGGILTFTTDATPDAVVAFYKQRAEAAGLKAITAMNQGDARAYGAGDGVDGRGKLLSVVASPSETGATSVQLSWSAGR